MGQFGCIRQLADLPSGKMLAGYPRDYVEWISDAKREETRSKRRATTIQWREEGKPRNWKYMNC